MNPYEISPLDSKLILYNLTTIANNIFNTAQIYYKIYYKLYIQVTFQTEAYSGGGGGRPSPPWISEIYGFQGVFGPQKVLSSHPLERNKK